MGTVRRLPKGRKGVSPLQGYLAGCAAAHVDALLACAPELEDRGGPAVVVYLGLWKDGDPLILKGDRCQVSHSLSLAARSHKDVDPYVDPTPSQEGAHLFVVGPGGKARGYVPWPAVIQAKEKHADQERPD